MVVVVSYINTHNISIKICLISIGLTHGSHSPLKVLDNKKNTFFS